MTETETYSLGAWLKQQRERLRLTQRALAASAHCSAAMIKKIEADERRPSPELAALLAISLSVPAAERELFLQVARGERPVDGLWHLAQGEAAEPALPFHAPAPLPRPATAFIGRADELGEIGRRLANRKCRLLTLVGPGGVGKTRLALAAGEAQRAAFAEGVAFVPVAAVTDPAAIPEAVARSLRLTVSGPPAEQVLAFLHRRSLLLVLDDCEHLAGALGWLPELLTQAPGVKVLATSRERLHLAEEWVYAVPELAQAEALFIETAQRVKHDFDAEAERPAIARICQLVDNLPLAVELAAGWTPLLACAQIAEHIQRDIAILAANVHNVPERHRSIQAVFDHSWNLLTPAEHEALMRLTVFRGGWRAEEGQRVAGADLFVLRSLVDKSLVRVGDGGRYDLHDLSCQYAAQQLARSGAVPDTQQRHFDAYLALAEQLNVQQFGPEAAAVVARFEQELDNFRAALGWSLEAAPVAAPLELLDHLSFFFSRRGYYREYGEWALRAIERAGPLESGPLCLALAGAATCAFLLGRFGEGEALAKRSVALAQRLGDPEALIMAHAIKIFASLTLDEALEGVSAGTALIRQTGKLPEMLPLFYLGSATWYHSSGRFAEAEAYYRESIAEFRKLGIIEMMADALERLGQLALQAGRLEEAQALTVESIAIAERTGYDIVFGAWGTARLGLIQLYLGQAEAAQRSLETALQMFQDGRGDERAQQETLAMLSEVALARGAVEAADRHLQASLALCRKFYHELQATRKFEGTAEALPVELSPLCARAALVAAAQRRAERAVTLGSLAHSLSAQSGQTLLPPLQARLDEALAGLARLAGAAYAAAWDAGQSMSLSEAFAFLLA